MRILWLLPIPLILFVLGTAGMALGGLPACGRWWGFGLFMVGVGVLVTAAVGGIAYCVLQSGI